MRLRDLPDILRIEKASFTTPWSENAFLSELLENDYAFYLVARVGEQAVGYVGVWLIAGEGHITNIAVHPDYRRQGLGRRLMMAIEQLCRERRISRMTLEVRRSNAIAQSLYRQLGYVGAGYRRGYYRDNNEDALIMWKDLRQQALTSSSEESP
ncbi:MAG: ribosomal protein S18-alanine N-acetyltransferase [Firmicutes bacterium]|jgi:ribosomal-protein-alanine N-acetyltransferase|nr:ribosomal protein S18-alanine N-acetyltransferase [Bacillota bacterium]